MPERLFIGLMSGTSVDGIDAALVSIGGPKPRYTLKVIRHLETKWPGALRERLIRVMAPAETSTHQICQLNFLVAQQFASAAGRLLAGSRISRKKISAIGSHGQTICHLPPRPGERLHYTPSTLQLGDVSVLATLAGIRTVGNFRTADMAVGGQGAPLVPWTDAALLTEKKISRAVQNIGGIGNVTFLPAAGSGPVIAFDTGPGNVLIDAVMSLATDGKQHFDKNGRLAKKGNLDRRLFNALREHPHFARRPPKSTGREEFGIHLARQVVDVMHRVNGTLPDFIHTVTRLTAWSIVDAYLAFLPHLPGEIILCGGGADNPTLVRMLHDEFAIFSREDVPPAIRRIDDFGIPNKAKEAASFALLAAATLDGIPANLPSVTGASQRVILGTIACPSV
jgi:anhydro-N-acetylmuramic acid kinase